MRLERSTRSDDRRACRQHEQGGRAVIYTQPAISRSIADLNAPLLGAFVNELRLPTASRIRRINDLQVIACERELSRLLHSCVVGVRTAFKAHGERLVGLVDREGAEGGDASVYCSLVFVRRTLHAALRREMGNIASHDVRGIPATVGEDEEALGIRAPYRAAIRSLAGAGYERPGSNKLLFEFLLRDDIADMQENQNKCRQRSGADSAKAFHGTAPISRKPNGSQD